MKTHLMYCDRDFEVERDLPEGADVLEDDLGLAVVLDAMAGGDGYLRDLAERALLLHLTDIGEIEYRQQILADCLARPDTLRRLYQLAIDGLDAKREGRLFWFRDSPDSLIHQSIAMVSIMVSILGQLYDLMATEGRAFQSEGLRRLVDVVSENLAPDYLATVRQHLELLGFPGGVLISATPGRGSRPSGFVLRRRPERSLLERLTPSRSHSFSFTIPARDEYGSRALAELQDHGLAEAANAAAQATDHLVSFFSTLRAELGFYISCLNLHEALATLGAPTCIPDAVSWQDSTRSARDLYDGALALHLGSRPVGNDLTADGKKLVVVTGANQGGKSTFLRSVGLAQVMLQAGMFVCAAAYRSSPSASIFTHFKREEDASMTRGKLEEELYRMSRIADQVQPRSLVLCNESFASTNEREGSEIAKTVIAAMTEAAVDMVFVTHLYELADGLYSKDADTSLFLRAERTPDGQRTFRIVPGKPESTSYGQDAYRRVFGTRYDPTYNGAPPPQSDAPAGLP